MSQVYKLKPSFSSKGPRFRINYEKELTEEQLPIVSAGKGPILVIAGAGSGKTRTVTYRVAYLVESGVPLERILLVTFTNKAAKEMIYRVEGLLKQNLSRLWGGTFHHIGNLILRKHAKAAGLKKNFTILDRTDSRDLFEKSVRAAGINTKEKKFPKGAVLQDVYSYMINTQETVPKIIEAKYPHLFELQREIVKVIEAYGEAKLEQNLVDFDDLLSKWHELLLEHDDIRRKYAERFEYILVDEYQDTNLLQAQIIDLLASKHKNLMVVGDDSQCVMKGTKILTPKGYKNVERLKKGEDLLSGGGNGRLVTSKITEKRKNHHSAFVTIKTKQGKRVCVSPNHLCFGKLRSLPGYWYVYLMYREDMGFRIGITNLPRFQRSNPRIQMRTTGEKGERLWLLEACENRQKAQYAETVLSLRYRIPQTIFCPEWRTNKAFITMNKNQAMVIFKEFGQNGFNLLKKYGLMFDYPTFAPKASKSSKRIAINLLMAAASNRKEKRQKQGHELQVESRYGWEAVRGTKGAHCCKGYWRLRKHSSNYKYLLEIAEKLKIRLRKHGYQAIIIYKAKFLPAKEIPGGFRIMPAAGLLPGMLVPIVKDKKIVIDEIRSVEKIANKNNISFYDIEVEKAHNIISEGIITHNSIYSFRGAEFKNIIEFPSRYPGCSIYKIETNHRSTPEILDFANDSIRNASQRFEKNLIAVRKKGSPPVVASFRDVYSQAAFVAQRILELSDEGLSLNEVAVLYRSHYHCLELQLELTRRGIPFEVRSGLRLWEEAHIKDVLAYLKIFQNPYDGLAWMRILKLLPKVGQKTAEKLWIKLKRSPDPIKTITASLALALVPNATQKIFEEFQILIKALSGMTNAPGSMIETIVDHGYSDYLKMTYPNFQMRLDELKELENYAMQYKELEKFLSSLVLLGGVSAEEIVGPGEKPLENVILTTVHQAKGLEWKVVFVIWLAEGRFPSYLSFGSEKEIEEERRLFYVAVTRSKDQLYLTYPVVYNSREGTIFLKASRFLKEVSENRYEKWLIEEEDQDEEELDVVGWD